MTSWKEFTQVAPRIAAVFTRRHTATGALCMLATLRSDGFPRPMCLKQSVDYPAEFSPRRRRPGEENMLDDQGRSDARGQRRYRAGFELAAGFGASQDGIDHL